MSRETIGEGAETSTVRVSTGTGSTFAADRTVTLTLAAEGTATEHDDFTIGSKSLTLPAGVGTTPSEITTVVAAVQDRIDEADEETILVDAAIGTDAVGSRRTVAVADDDERARARVQGERHADRRERRRLDAHDHDRDGLDLRGHPDRHGERGRRYGPRGERLRGGRDGAHPPGRLGPRSPRP